MKKTILLIFICFAAAANAQQIIPLYKDSIPNIKVDLKSEEQPTLEIYLPTKEKSTGTSVIIFPGGAYQFLAYQEEGVAIAKAFIEKGITAFVVKYRLPSDITMKNKSIGPLQDAQQAIKTIRLRSKEWNLDPKAVGIIGFSAGGHLASTLGTHFTTNYIENLEKTNLRPNFMILVYPVITMDSKLTHLGSRGSLLGTHPSENQIWMFSNEQQVSFDTPPTYLTHAGDDSIVDVNNSIVFYKALQNNNVDAELHLFPKGDHGFTQRLPVNEWLDPMLLWLKKEGFYTPKKTK